MERHASARASASGALVIKLWPTRAGLPDRLVLVPGGQAAFVEWKTATGRVSPVQEAVFSRLAALGWPVTVCRSQADFKAVLTKLEKK